MHEKNVFPPPFKSEKILLGFWHWYFKPVSLRFPSCAVGYLHEPDRKSQHGGLAEGEQQVPREEPVAPARQRTRLPALSHCYSEQARGDPTSAATDALAYEEERRARTASGFLPVRWEARGRRSRCSLPG